MTLWRKDRLPTETAGKTGIPHVKSASGLGLPTLHKNKLKWGPNKHSNVKLLEEKRRIYGA